MRYAFGLVSLLVVTAIILLLFAKYEIPVAQKGKETQDEVQPLVGKTADGVQAKDSVKVDGQVANGELRSLLVTNVTPDGFFDQYYGLKVGDKVLQINEVDVGSLGDSGMAESMLWSVKPPQTITISRNGQKRTLTVSDGSLKTRAIGSGSGSPGGPSPTPAAPGGSGNSGNSGSGNSGSGNSGSGIPGLPNSIQVPNQQ
jgi:hypothetical protein